MFKFYSDVVADCVQEGMDLELQNTGTVLPRLNEGELEWSDEI